ncbi:hypothetical protein BHM03_00017390 [Ensete ventricosum]|nr:hypothetical protein BHM03_00017390 [Ensete ventricosum]
MSKQESVGRRSDGGAAVRATGAWWIGSGWELGLGFGPWSRGSSAAGTGAAIDVERERAACGRPWADPFAFSKPWEEGQPSMPAAWSEVVGFALSQVVNHSALLLHDSSAYVGDHGHNGPPLSVVVTTEDHHHHGEKGEVVVKYRECHKNHAASIGGSATDGCGEFMPSGEEGTPPAAATGKRQKASPRVTASAQPGLPHTQQKEKMLSFAEKVGWRRLQKQEEIGVKRRVLKVWWMHNNKHNLAGKASLQLE